MTRYELPINATARATTIDTALLAYHQQRRGLRAEQSLQTRAGQRLLLSEVTPTRFAVPRRVAGSELVELPGYGIEIPAEQLPAALERTALPRAVRDALDEEEARVELAAEERDGGPGSAGGRP